VQQSSAQKFQQKAPLAFLACGAVPPIGGVLTGLLAEMMAGSTGPLLGCGSVFFNIWIEWMSTALTKTVPVPQIDIGFPPVPPSVTARTPMSAQPPSTHVMCAVVCAVNHTTAGALQRLISSKNETR
jgi:hypothetical protein